GGWWASIRSWFLTVLIALAIALPMLWAVGRSQLAYYIAQANLERLSRTDPLTGLPNRRAILETAEDIGDDPLLLMIIDLDHFKNVNDSYGHRAGDFILATVAQRIQMELADIGVTGRLGGEEFAILVPAEGAPSALVRMQTFCRSLASTPIVAHGASVRVTISVGAAFGTGRLFDRLYMEADRALYRAKALGRNRLCLDGDVQREHTSTTSLSAAG
ncbi:MAG: GGDEF domain-containing protein, partial [Pseudolabrys sp.]|nr:GGDEF domain-containing protein [Pseudolabrys sp.]